MFLCRQDQFYKGMVGLSGRCHTDNPPAAFWKDIEYEYAQLFFSNQYAGRGDLFEGMSVWEDEEYRKLQGTYPVIFLSFADVKQNNYIDAVAKVKNIIIDVYAQYEKLYL